MDKKSKNQKVYVTKFTIKTANERIVLSTKTRKDFVHRGIINGNFVSRGELKEAFKTASRKLKSA